MRDVTRSARQATLSFTSFKCGLESEAWVENAKNSRLPTLTLYAFRVGTDPAVNPKIHFTLIIFIHVN